MIEYLPQALSSLDVALKIGKSLVNIRDMTLFQSEFIEFNNAIIEAQSKISLAQRNETALLFEIDKLKKEIMRIKDWSSERENYALREIGEGAFVYLQNQGVQSFESSHKLCCNCFDNKQLKSTLQQSREPGRMRELTCPNGCPKIVFSHYLDMR